MPSASVPVSGVAIDVASSAPVKIAAVATGGRLLLPPPLLPPLPLALLPALP